MFNRIYESIWPSQPAESKDDPNLKNYEACVKAYKEKTVGLSSLYKHILYVLNKDNPEKPFSTGEAIAKVLQAMGDPSANMKGGFIYLFNAAHRGGNWSCPFFKNTDLKPTLHLGTTRVWNHDGTVNEERWKALLDYAAEENKTIISLSRMNAYLQHCADTDAEELDTGRHTNSFTPFSKKFQTNAAVAAWGEVYERLACGWREIKDTDASKQAEQKADKPKQLEPSISASEQKADKPKQLEPSISVSEQKADKPKQLEPSISASEQKADKPKQLEPYLSVSVIREFFEDSPIAYLRAECGLLPVPNPQPVQSAKTVCAIK